VSIRNELELAARNTADTIDRLSRSFARELGNVLRETERSLPAVVEASVESRTAIVKATRANRLRKDLRSVLERAGYDALVDEATGERLDRITARVLDGRRLAKATASLTASMELRLEGLRALQLGELLDEGDEIAAALWKATLRGVFGSQEPDRILRDLAYVLDKTQPQIETLYDTAITMYGRQVDALLSGDDPETPFLYTGPDDEKTRDFCAERVNKVFTRAEIDAMDNGQLSNVFLTGGGYNCRHRFMEVSKFSELRQAA
jgi:hypothetical protein